jgi:hypothetical protein
MWRIPSTSFGLKYQLLPNKKEFWIFINLERGILHDGKKILANRSLQRNIRPTSDNTSYNRKTSSDMNLLYPQ